MCESKISDRCTGVRAYKLADGREVCGNCMHFCTSGLSIQEPERISAMPRATNPEMPLSSDEANGRPRGFRFD